MTLSNIVQMNHFPEENRTLDEIRSEEDEIESYLKISNVLEEILEDKKNGISSLIQNHRQRPSSQHPNSLRSQSRNI